jgi:hypothetical protein
MAEYWDLLNTGIVYSKDVFIGFLLSKIRQRRGGRFGISSFLGTE